MPIVQENFSLKAIGYYQKQMLVALKSDYKSLWVDYFLNLILCYTWAGMIVGCLWSNMLTFIAETWGSVSTR
jgi:hypothetical protein